MIFQKKIEYKKLEKEILVYFVDQQGRIQGTLKSYLFGKSEEIRENLLLYTQEYIDGEPSGTKKRFFFSME